MKNMVTLVLIGSLLLTPAGAIAQGVEAADPWEVVVSAPMGVSVLLTMTDGSKIKGTVAAASADGVTLEEPARDKGPLVLTTDRRVIIHRVDVVGVASSMTRYSTTGSTADVGIVRHVILAFGRDRKIDVRTPTKHFRGTIQSIEQNTFTVTHGIHHAPEQISYGDVRRLSPAGMSLGEKVAIAAGLGVLVWYLIFRAVATAT